MMLLAGLWRIATRPHSFHGPLFAMNITELTERAMQVHACFAEAARRRGQREWSREQIMQGFVGDVGDLMKLVMAKSGAREINDVDAKLSHELADCLWSVLVLAKLYGVDLNDCFLRTMDELERDLKQAKP